MFAVNHTYIPTALLSDTTCCQDDNDPHRDAAIPSYSQLPLSWSNGGIGGCNISAVPGTPLGASLTAYTGAYTLKPAVQPPLTNGSRVFRWDMSVTPFKPRNESLHWNLRHFQVGYPSSAFTSAEDVHKTGVKTAMSLLNFPSAMQNESIG
jgi:hypothetical protein